MLKRRSTISHDRVEFSLSALQVFEIPALQHLAVVPDHILDPNRIVFAVVGAIGINTAYILRLARQFSQPRASLHFLACDGADPDLSIPDVRGDIGTMDLPPLNFVFAGR